VVQAIFNKLMTLNALTKVPELYGIYSQYVETNLSLGDILPYLSMAATIRDTSNIQRYVIGPNEAYPWTTESGAMVLVPDYARIHSILVEALHLDQ
ncbi:MAG: hypothetical protein MUO40_09490, partial [Anaerolineaceae bacterium]|nr:hypothetical protein [Anaerolineaceae bacterium]